MELVFVAQPNPPIKDKIWQIEVNYDRLPEHIKEGDVILVDNGLIPFLSFIRENSYSM